ncbi:MAG: copper amine oxidase N-terminal domain-containing protein [Armatimonadetes bacterium]|nr:hypothetical protein [Armatimonadota bacterium]MBS1703799.1 copper amine oxidase N-terminal domain-containing protein [Armatimonadota bacterium]MBS1726173.1 copper amine oxidase N-terminal domain-containing protein [Armatimonadota bacterium]
MNSLKMMKTGKVLGLATLAAMAAVGQASNIYVSVDGQRVNFEGTEPTMMDNHVMVPLRGVFEKMGATVDWDGADRTVMAQRANTRVELRINSTEAYVNGKAVAVNYPAVMVGGSTLVPIRFISESLGAYVDWDEASNTVMIDTTGNGNGAINTAGEKFSEPSYVLSVQPKGSVLPLKLDNRISSDDAKKGDKFTATVDTNGGNDYFGLPEGTRVEGHVNFAQAKKGDTPGVLGLDFDSIIMQDGRHIPIQASLIGLDKKSVTNEDGRLIANKNDTKDDMKYVGTGAGAGALIALVTKGNVVTSSLIGGALGYLYQKYVGSKQDVNNVVLDRGTPIGMRFDQEERIKVYNN